MAGGIGLTIGLSALSLLWGMYSSSQAEGASAAAQRQQWEDKIDFFKFAMGQAKTTMASELLELSRTGSMHLREKMAWHGAAGAEVGSGTPLMNMIQAEQDIQLEALAIKKTYLPEIEFYESEIEKLEERLNPVAEDQPVGPQGGHYHGTHKTHPSIHGHI